MGSRTPLQGGIIVALVWILLQAAIWAAAAIATLFLSVLLLMLVLLPLTTTPNWIGP